jgi:predicted DNA-binding WGR domain protein
MPPSTTPTHEEIIAIEELIVKEPNYTLLRVWRTRSHVNDFWFYLEKPGNQICYGYKYSIKNDSYSTSNNKNFFSSQESTLNSHFDELDLSSMVKKATSEESNCKNARHYTHTEDGHNKFWHVSMPNETAVTTKWGRIGTIGQCKTKNYATNAMAVEAFEQLYKSKEAKGYKLDKIVVNKKIKMPEVPAVPKEPTAAEEGLSEALDILDLE